MKYLSSTTGNPPSLLRKSVATISTVALAGVALMFSAVLLSFILIVGTMAFAYLWWKTRELRKQMQKQMQDFPFRNASMEREVFTGEVIEGEVIRMHESGDGIKR